jgi:hypothetical protein
MSNKKHLLTVCLIFTFLFSCEEQSIEPDKVTSIEQSYLKNLPTDPFFRSFISGVDNLSGLTLNEGVDVYELQSLFNNAETDDQVIEIVNTNFQNPEGVIRRLRDFGDATMDFKEAHQDFYLLDASQRDAIFSESISLMASNRSVAFSGECEDYLENDKDTCANAAYIAAAGCGLLTPTFFGALICAGVVIAGDIACHTAAENNYETCKEYENVQD